MKSNKTAKAFAWFSALVFLFGIALFFAADKLATPWMSYTSSPRPVSDTVATLHHVSATLIVIGVVLAAVALSARSRSPRPAQQQ